MHNDLYENVSFSNVNIYVYLFIWSGFCLGGVLILSGEGGGFCLYPTEDTPHYTNMHPTRLLNDKYPNFELGLKCILIVFPCLLLCSYINGNAM